jgi:glutathione S-transferase
MDRLELYDMQVSSNARIARMVAAQLDLPLEIKPVDMAKGAHKQSDYMKLNPNGKVPTLKHGDFVLWESNAIALYMASLRPESDLLPRDPKLAAQVDQWLFWRNSHFQPSFSKISFERVVKAWMKMGPPDEAAVEQAMRDFDGFARVLDAHLASRKFVVGEKLTVADISLACSLTLRHMAQLDTAKWPNLHAWLARIEALRSFKNTEPTQ